MKTCLMSNMVMLAVLRAFSYISQLMVNASPCLCLALHCDLLSLFSDCLSNIENSKHQSSSDCPCQVPSFYKATDKTAELDSISLKNECRTVASLAGPVHLDINLDPIGIIPDGNSDFATQDLLLSTVYKPWDYGSQEESQMAVRLCDLHVRALCGEFLYTV
uniref:FZ domain-containing protein n=1 Tax=Panagrellus redivivus TaxID=6233 RepID=A0A7E4VRS8_PANRE